MELISQCGSAAYGFSIRKGAKYVLNIERSEPAWTQIGSFQRAGKAFASLPLVAPKDRSRPGRNRLIAPLRFIGAMLRVLMIDDNVFDFGQIVLAEPHRNPVA